MGRGDSDNPRNIIQGVKTPRILIEPDALDANSTMYIYIYIAVACTKRET